MEDTNPEVWAEVLRLAGELKKYGSAFLASEPEQTVYLTSPTVWSLRYVLRELDGEKLLFTVNPWDKTFQARFRIAEEVDTLTVVDEDRVVVVEDQVFVDTFEPHDVHIYKIG